MLIGAHVRGGGALTDRLVRGVELGADAIQVFTQSPRAWKPTQYAPDVLAAYRAAAHAHPTVRATYCHATYLINLATPDDTLYSRSVECLINNLSVARGMAASGLVLHIGSHKGTGTEGAIARVAEGLRRALDEANDPDDAAAPACPILLENAAGAGGTVGRTLEELEAVIVATDEDERLGVCIDTQHLWASGVDYSSVALADAVIDEVRTRFGLERLGCMHLNDSKVERGSNRDRHENLGDGTIGAAGLASLVGHPDLATTAALLEVPGEGDGPRSVDVDAARAILEEGSAMRSSQRPSAGAAKAAKPARSATSAKAAKPARSPKAAKDPSATTKRRAPKKGA
ncbi:MAG TPA: deoxyribonuclease IV [Acidimicrobiales bacterium]|nr:deoxyribonuclease IV [Acidimicrobiales bacterium]